MKKETKETEMLWKILGILAGIVLFMSCSAIAGAVVLMQSGLP